jgi:hypothetical protein
LFAGETWGSEDFLFGGEEGLSWLQRDDRVRTRIFHGQARPTSLVSGFVLASLRFGGQRVGIRVVDAVAARDRLPLAIPAGGAGWKCVSSRPSASRSRSSCSGTSRTRRHFRLVLDSPQSTPSSGVGFPRGTLAEALRRSGYKPFGTVLLAVRAGYLYAHANSPRVYESVKARDVFGPLKCDCSEPERSRKLDAARVDTALLKLCITGDPIGFQTDSKRD